MAMVRIRGVRMLVGQRNVPMRVGMRLGDRTLVRVLMMLVVDVEMLVLERRVDVQMAVAGAHQDDRAAHHEDPGQRGERSRPFPQDGNGERRSDERRGGEKSGLARGAKNTKRAHVQQKAQAVAQAAQGEGDRREARARRPSKAAPSTAF